MSPRIGLQLYTVRGELERDLDGMLATVASLGYEGVELFGDLAAAPVRAAGLEVVGRHIGLDADVENLDCDRLVLAWIDPVETIAEREAAVARIVELGERVRATGRRFAFHNHWSEVPALEDGSSLLDRLPDWVDLELDLGWAWFAGADPLALLERWRGRTPLVHVKDLRARGTREFVPVGDGAVGYDGIVPRAAELGIEWLLVEQDELDRAPAEALGRSLEALRT
jgi:sugar phosphate isomerase/epimerase